MCVWTACHLCLRHVLLLKATSREHVSTICERLLHCRPCRWPCRSVCRPHAFNRAGNGNGSADERAAIERVFNDVCMPACPRSPMTGLYMHSRQLVTNRCARWLFVATFQQAPGSTCSPAHALPAVTWRCCMHSKVLVSTVFHALMCVHRLMGSSRCRPGWHWT